jgi:hypothetical protein
MTTEQTAEFFSTSEFPQVVKRTGKGPKRAPKAKPGSGLARLQQVATMDTVAAKAEPVTGTSNSPEISRLFLTAGKATFTLSKLATGERFTYEISKPEPFYGSFFASVMKGSDNESDYRYIAMMSGSDLRLRFTKGSRFAPDTKEARGLQFVLDVVAGRKVLPAGFELRRSSKCGRCGRKLTVPSSIDAGIGPECAGKIAA